MSYSQIGNQVVRDDGYVAVQHATSNPTNIMVSKVPYIFTPRSNVSMCWVAPEHVDKMTAVKMTGS